MSTARFRCDGRSVISDFANGWALIAAHNTDASQDGTTVVHLCVACRPRRADPVARLEQTGSLYWFIQFSYMGSNWSRAVTRSRQR